MGKILFQQFIGAVLLLLSSAVSASAQQCPCAGQVDTKRAYGDASVVVIGGVDRVSPSVFKEGYNEVVLNISRTIKGSDEIRSDKLVIYTKSSEEDCGFNFIQGLDYIVYAQGVPAFLTTDKCTRNTLLDKGIEELRRIKEVSKAAK